MDQLIERCAGLDVHKKTVAACVRTPGQDGQRQQHTRTFATTTKGLTALHGWLASQQVTVVGMESTGAYWKAVDYRLETTMDCWPLGRPPPAQRARPQDRRRRRRLDRPAGRARPGPPQLRATPPDPPAAQPRPATARPSSRSAPARPSGWSRLLEDAGIKLSCVAADIPGVSGRAMLAALVAGVRDPKLLAELAKGRLRVKIPLLQEALVGRFGPHHALIVSEMLARIDAADATIDRLSAEISRLTALYAAIIELLQTIPGVNRRTAEVILAETGGDMRQFPSAAHLASWAGLCPGNNESAGKHH